MKRLISATRACVVCIVIPEPALFQAHTESKETFIAPPRVSTVRPSLFTPV